MMIRTHWLSAAALVLALQMDVAYAQSGDARMVIGAMAIQAARESPRASRPYDERDWLERFYAPGGHAPVWLNDGARMAALAVALLQGADAHGLAPGDYQADTLARQLGDGILDARFDVALTQAMLRYLADLRVGRVRSEYHTSLPDPRLRAFDPVEQLRSALADGRLAAAIESAEPRIPLYAHTKAMLAHYRRLAEGPEEVLAPLPAGARLAPGARYAGAAALHARLVRLGDMDDEAARHTRTQRGRYSAQLADAVRQFQERHGLEPDGVLGRDTLAALNVPLKLRVRQLELTLERLRWLPDVAPGPVIAVNLPAFRLWAFDLGTPSPQPVLEMKVIVGASVKTPTPLFVGHMRYLEFNPYWNVPRSIVRAEIIPTLVRRRAYLAQNDMELLPLSGAGAPLRSVDAAALDALRAGKYRVRQRPGPRNALGAVKFAMPNPDNIYLHSTPARALFKRTRRDLSHGCIRVEHPAELAQFLLSDQAQWTREAIDAAMDPGPTRTVKLSAPVPVVLFYATAVTDRDGKALFPQDIYKRDPALERALETPALP